LVDRRDEIADMFKKYFHHYGFKKTSMDEVSGELHISKKTIYEYFDSKESVFAFIIKREADQASMLMVQKLENIPSQIEKTRVFIHLIFETAEKYLKNSRDLDFRDQDEIASLSFQTAYETVLQKLVEDGKKTGEFKLPCNDLNLAFLKAIIWQGLQTLKADPSNKPDEQTSEVIMKLLI
jgi:AcrR family transcriptional regulator